MEDVRIRIGKRIRQLRTANGVSQEAFAHQCGLDRTYISSVEAGRRNISIVAIEKVAKGLDVSLAELFEGL